VGVAAAERERVVGAAHCGLRRQKASGREFRRLLLLLLLLTSYSSSSSRIDVYLFYCKCCNECIKYYHFQKIYRSAFGRELPCLKHRGRRTASSFVPIGAIMVCISLKGAPLLAAFALFRSKE